MSGKERYTCSQCQKYYVASDTATRVKCPHCNHTNFLNGGVGTVPAKVVQQTSNASSNQTPTYSLHEVSRISKEYIYDNTSWSDVPVNYEGVNYCRTKLFCLNKEKIDVFATKAECTIEGPPMSYIIQLIWDPNAELHWNSNTISDFWVLQNISADEQAVYVHHKTTSAATARNDCVYFRRKEVHDDHAWIYASSEKTSLKPEQSGWRRGYVVFSGFLVQAIGPNKHTVTFVHCWDFNGLIHVKFVEEEQKRVALRLSKLRKMALEYKPVKQQTQQPPQQTHQPPQQTQQQSYQTQEAPSIGGGVKRICLKCNLEGDSKFCGECGTPLVYVCGKCNTPAEGSKFCGECGNNLS